MKMLRNEHKPGNMSVLVQSPKTVDLSAYMAAWRAAIKPPSGARIAVDIDPYSFL